MAIFLGSCKKDATQSPAINANGSLAASKPLNSVALSRFHKKLTKGLIAWYPFLGNANDMSGNGNNGTLTYFTDPGTGISGNLPVLTAGKCGDANGAYSFDGTGGFIYTNSFFTDSVREFSIYVRFKAGSSGVLLATGDFYMQLPATSLSVGSDNSIGFTWQNIFLDQQGAFLTSFVSAGPLTVGPKAWVDVVVNFKNDVLTIYRDGKKVASANAAFPVGNFGGGGYIGAEWSRYPGGFLTGTIDEVRVYDKSLSVGEITDLYQHCKKERHQQQ